LGTAIVVSALVAAPASVWAQVSEPAAAAAQNPSFSIYSNDGGRFSGTMASQVPPGDATESHLSVVRPHRGHHGTGFKRY
jgi:non-ribosomal peptide synthetase component E (peptide arylation enzyme)